MRFTYVLLGLVQMTSLLSSSGLCSNGVTGVQDGEVCCEDQCGTCGGVGCDDRPGGDDACCYTVIKNSGVMCSENMEAPCIIDFCSNGVPGVQDAEVCCEEKCGTCGGPGCNDRPGGSDACCYTTIKDSGVMCIDTMEAPCVINRCSNGVPGVQDGDVCCEEQCGTCGGLGCDLRPGGSDACCYGIIKNSGVMCSDTLEAPCNIDPTLE